MKTRKEYPTYKTIRQWAKEGFMAKPNAQGIELWANGFRQKSYIYYSPDEVDKADTEKINEFFSLEKERNKLYAKKQKEKRCEEQRQAELKEIYDAEYCKRENIKNAILPHIYELISFYTKNEHTTDGVIVLDTETTGLNVQVDEIIQLSIIDGNGAVLYNSYFNPCADSWDDSETIHHISPYDVMDEPRLSEEITKISSILARAHTIIGYSLEFDIEILKRSKIIIPDNVIFIDVAEMFAPIAGDWDECYNSYRYKKLTYAANYFNYEWVGDAHDSLADCRATLHVYNNLIEKGKKSNG